MKKRVQLKARRHHCVICGALTYNEDELFKNFVCPACCESGAWGREIDRRIEVYNSNDLYSQMLSASMATGISIERLKCYSRIQAEVEARWLFIYLASKNTKRSLAAIGRYCNKDHCTVLNALEKIELYKRTNRPFRERWDEWMKKTSTT